MRRVVSYGAEEVSRLLFDVMLIHKRTRSTTYGMFDEHVPRVNAS